MLRHTRFEEMMIDKTGYCADFLNCQDGKFFYRITEFYDGGENFWAAGWRRRGVIVLPDTSGRNVKLGYPPEMIKAAEMEHQRRTGAGYVDFERKGEQ